MGRGLCGTPVHQWDEHLAGVWPFGWPAPGWCAATADQVHYERRLARPLHGRAQGRCPAEVSAMACARSCGGAGVRPASEGDGAMTSINGTQVDVSRCHPDRYVLQRTFSPTTIVRRTTWTGMRLLLGNVGGSAPQLGTVDRSRTKGGSGAPRQPLPCDLEHPAH